MLGRAPFAPARSLYARAVAVVVLGAALGCGAQQQSPAEASPRVEASASFGGDAAAPPSLELLPPPVAWDTATVAKPGEHVVIESATTQRACSPVPDDQGDDVAVMVRVETSALIRFVGGQAFGFRDVHVDKQPPPPHGADAGAPHERLLITTRVLEAGGPQARCPPPRPQRDTILCDLFYFVDNRLYRTPLRLVELARTCPPDLP